METVSARGADVPVLGLGTWQLTGSQCYESVSTALELGDFRRWRSGGPSSGTTSTSSTSS